VGEQACPFLNINSNKKKTHKPSVATFVIIYRQHYHQLTKQAPKSNKETSKETTKDRKKERNDLQKKGREKR